MLPKNITWKDFEAHCKQIEQSTAVTVDDSPKDKAARIERAKKDYAFFWEYYFPNYAKSKSAKYHVKLANELKSNKTFKGIFEGHRGCAKSTHADIGYALWLKINGLMKCMLLVGQTETKAQRLLAAVQAQLMSNQRFIRDYGPQFSYGNWADGEFTTKDNTTFFAIGLGQSPNGTRKDEYRPDYIVCDDLDSKKMSKNPRLVRDAVNWIQEDLMGCFDIGNERFLFVNSRISKTSILVSLIDEMVTKNKKPWFYMQINAVDKKGNPTWPEKYTREYWKEKREGMTLRAWLANYMNNPVVEGTIFKIDWIKFKKIPELKKYEQLVAYCDPSFKNNANSDFKAIKFWGKIGKELHLIKAFVRQSSVSTMVKWFYDLHESIPSDVICDYYMEANFLQDLLLDEFTEEGLERGYQLPIRGDKRAKPDKFSRIEATSPLYERGFIFYNEEFKDDPDLQKGVEQLLAIEQGSNTPDDSPDADEGAIFMLQRRGRSQNFNAIIGEREQRDY